jgi:hypothetical protein
MNFNILSNVYSPVSLQTGVVEPVPFISSRFFAMINVVNKMHVECICNLTILQFIIKKVESVKYVTDRL